MGEKVCLSNESLNLFLYCSRIIILERGIGLDLWGSLSDLKMRMKTAPTPSGGDEKRTPKPLPGSQHWAGNIQPIPYSFALTTVIVNIISGWLKCVQSFLSEDRALDSKGYNFPDFSI